MVAEGCDIQGVVENSIIFTGCRVEPGAVIRDSVVMPNTRVEEGARLEYAMIGENTVIGKGALIGRSPKDYAINAWGIAVVGSNRTVADEQVITPKEVV